ncbi:hypothetical protein OAS39_05650 [Pirellulales bacterium]|nr:hypothetical protein [Pirellulales bacterium]
MPGLSSLHDQLLTDGNITDAEVTLVRTAVERDGELDLEDVKFLIKLLIEADEVCPAFDEFFFATLKSIFLADGKIGQDEQYYLLKMLYADGILRDNEREFLEQLRREVAQVSPEFEAMCETAALSPSVDWALGGKDA